MSVFRAITLWKKVSQRFLKPCDHEKKGIKKIVLKNVKRNRKKEKGTGK